MSTSPTEPTGTEHSAGAPTVIVGVSPNSGSPTAVKWAADIAGLRRAQLVAIRAWRAPRPPTTPAGRPPAVRQDPEVAFASAEKKLRAEVDATLREAGIGEDVDVVCRLVRGSAMSVLQKASAGASMMVIDAPRRTDLSKPPLLAHRLVYQARCPVLVIPPPVSGLPDTALVRGGKRLSRDMAKSVAMAGKQGER